MFVTRLGLDNYIKYIYHQNTSVKILNDHYVQQRFNFAKVFSRGLASLSPNKLGGSEVYKVEK